MGTDMAYKCVIWGIGNEYEKMVNQINFEISKGNIEIMALVSKAQDIVGKTFDGFMVIQKEDLIGMQFDYLIIASSLYFTTISNEAAEIGIAEERIINGSVLTLPLFDFNRYVELKNKRITILADDCWGGYIYHYLYMKFYSPLINCYWQKDSFARFMQRPGYYLNQPLKMEREGDIRGNVCPIGSLGEGSEKVYVDFVHSLYFIDAEMLWNKRLKRINSGDFFIKFGIDASDERREGYLKAFDKVKQNKVCFYSGNTQIGGVTYLKRFEKFVRTGSRVDTMKYHDYSRNLTWLLKSVDILKLLNGENDFLRE